MIFIPDPEAFVNEMNQPHPEEKRLNFIVK